MVQKYVCTYDFVLVSDFTKLWKLPHLVYNHGENYLCKSQVDKWFLINKVEFKLIEHKLYTSGRSFLSNKT